MKRKKKKRLKLFLAMPVCGESWSIFVRKEKNIAGMWPNFFIFAQSL